MRIVLLGPPGAGKGTQAARLARHLGIAHVATGDMFRVALASATDLGRLVRSYVERGELVPDEVTNELVRERLGRDDVAKAFLLDGYPRTLEQAEVLDKILAERGEELDLVARFMVTGPVIVERLSGRRVCPKDHSVYHVVTNPPKVPGICDFDGTPLIQREDDREETILHRLEVYGAQTKPLLDYYGGRGLMVEVDAIGREEEVFERLVEAVSPEASAGLAR
ncbi:MAG: adenylate kinase [Actinomycetota bacterium]